MIFVISLISKPKIAAIAPSPLGNEFCIALPRIFNKLTESVIDSEFNAVREVYSPKE